MHVVPRLLDASAADDDDEPVHGPSLWNDDLETIAMRRNLEAVDILRIRGGRLSTIL
jgi:hypothetical protein